MQFNPLLFVAMIVAACVALLLVGCSRPLAQRIDGGCVKHGGLGSISPNVIVDSGGQERSLVRIYYCRDGTMRAAEE